MADKSFFPRLKRLFSSDVIIRNIGGDKIRVIDTQRIQANGSLETNELVDRFTKIHKYGYNNGFNNTENYQTLRIQLYTDYEAMDTHPIISSVLDILSEESSLKNEMGEILQIRSDNEKIQKILYNLFYDILNIEFNLAMWVRGLVKYGDFYLKLSIAEKIGIYNAIPLSVYDVVREEGKNPENPHEITFRLDSAYNMGGVSRNNPKNIYENYEIAHFRLLGDPNFLPYGRCIKFDSKIYTENGLTEIQHIKKGDKVWTFNIEENKYELADVLATCNSGLKKLYNIRTVHNEIEVSDNHPMLVWDENLHKPVYKQAKFLQKGDYLCTYKDIKFAYQNPKLNKDRIELTQYDWKTDLNPYNTFPNTITPEFARFWGFMLGDGWENPTNYTIGFARGINDERNRYYEDLLIKFSGKNKLNELHSKNSKVKLSGVSVNSKVFYDLMKINGFIGKSYSKRLPEWIYQCDEETQLSLIKGLMDADGYISEDKWNCKSYNITLVNNDLLKDVKYLLDRLKIKTGKIRPRKFKGKCTINGQEYNARQSYDFTFYLDGELKRQYTKYNNINPDYNVELFKIQSIVEQLPDTTFDIQVSKNSNFIANGIIVHNSYIEPARKLFKQLTLLEDAMLIHRIMRAPEKRIFYINVGNIPPAEVDAFIAKTIAKMKKTPFVDPQTGDYNLKFNMQNITEDFFIPVRGNDQTTKIDTTKGLEYAGIEDITYLRENLFAALKVPKAFIGFEKDLEGKSTLSSQDIRFSRSIDKIQRIILSELYKMAIVHLISQGFEDAELVNFELSLTGPSIIYEQEKVALYKEKTDLAKQMQDTDLFSSDFILDTVFKLSDDQINIERERVIEDKKRKFRLEQIANEGNDPQETGESYGTPHDLAVAYGKGRMGDEIPNSEDKKLSVGRPETRVSDYGTDKSSFGRDPIGRQGMKEKEPSTNLQLEYLKKTLNMGKAKKKKLITEKKKSILDESNIKE